MTPIRLVLKTLYNLIRDKQTADANKTIANFEAEGIQVLNGRYGPYIKKGKDNYKIPKDKSAEHLTLEDVQLIIGDRTN